MRNLSISQLTPSLYDLAGIYVVMVDTKGNILDANIPFAETFQYNKPLQSTHATFECVLTEDFSSYQDVVEKCNQYPNQSFEVELRIKNKQGDIRANYWRFIRRDEGNHNFILGIGFDDTNAQEKIYALEAIKNNPNGLVIATDRKGVVNFASRGFEELLKLPLDQILGKHFSHFLFKEDAQYGEHIFSEIFKNGKTLGGRQIRVVDALGNPVWLFGVSSINPLTQQLVLSFVNIQQIKNYEEEIHYLKELSSTITSICNQLINANPETFSSVVQTSLQLLGELTDSDRSYVFDYDWDNKVMKNTYEWCADGISPEIDNLQALSIDDYHWWATEHHTGREIVIRDVDLLEDKTLRQLLQSQNIKSLIALPIMVEHKCIGFIGFDAVKNYGNWSEEEVRLLKIFAAILSSVALRFKKETELIRTKDWLYETAKLAKVGGWEYNISSKKLIWSDIVKEIHEVPEQFEPDLNTAIEFYTEGWSRTAIQEEFNNALITGNSFEGEFTITTAKGNIKWVQSSGVVKFENGKPMKVIGTIRDITNKVDAREEKLKMIHELSITNKDLKQFTYIVSHNLRTHAANLLGLSYLLEDKDLDSQTEQEVNQNIKKSAELLDNSLLDLNEILKIKEDRNLKIDEVNLEEAFANAFRLNTTIGYQDDIDVQINLQQKLIKGNKAYVESIFFNLISNSIKYKKENEGLCIAVKSNVSQQRIIITYTDNGTGLDTDKMNSKLFQIYQRFHTHIPGKGLGLYMIKSQVEAMRGTASVEGKEGVGLTFYLSFPI